MIDLDTEEVDDALAGFMNLAAGVFAASRYAVLAEQLAELCAPLPDLAAGIAGTTARCGAFLRRKAAATAAHAQRAATAAAAAGAALADTAPVHARAGDRETRRKPAKRVHSAIRKTAKALESARRDACAAGRCAAGVAAVHDSNRAPGPLWHVALNLLGQLPIDSEDDDVVLTLTGGEDDRRALAGLVAHVGLNHPALLVAELDDGRGRYVQLVSSPDASVLIESVSDAFLDPSHRITDTQRRALADGGFHAPDEEHVNWHRFEDEFSVTALADLLLETLAGAHGATPDDHVRITLALAACHPDKQHLAEDEPAALELGGANVAAMADALAARLRSWIEVVGVDRIWASVDQPGWPYFAHLGSNMDGGLFTEVTGNFYLDEDDGLDDLQVAHLRALGWDDPIDDQGDDPEIQPRNHTRVWPAPFDLDAACWHVALTCVAVYGLDLEEPVLVEVRLI